MVYFLKKDEFWFGEWWVIWRGGFGLLRSKWLGKYRGLGLGLGLRGFFKRKNIKEGIKVNTKRKKLL